MTQKLSPARATTKINELARNPNCAITKCTHFEEQLNDREIIASDTQYLIKNGFVYEKAVPSTQKGLWKYKIVCETPNSNGRTLGLIIIPDFQKGWIKFVTIFWVDKT